MWLGTVTKSLTISFFLSLSFFLCSISHGTSVLFPVLSGGPLIFSYNDCSSAPHIICSIQALEEKFYFCVVFMAWIGLWFFLKHQTMVRRWFDWIKSVRPTSTALLLHCGGSKLPLQGKSPPVIEERRNRPFVF